MIVCDVAKEDTIEFLSEGASSQTGWFHRFFCLQIALQIVTGVAKGLLKDAFGKTSKRDVSKEGVINTFHVGGQPHFIITGLYPSYISLTPQQSFLLNAFATLLHYIAAIVVVLAAVIGIIVNRRKTRRSLF